MSNLAAAGLPAARAWNRLPSRPALALIGLTLLLCAGLGLGEGLHALFSRRALLESTRLQLNNLSRAIAQQAADTVDLAATVLGTLTARPFEQLANPENRAALDRELTGMVTASHCLRSITLLDAEGRELASSLPVGVEPEPGITNRDLLGYHRETAGAEPYLGLPVRGRDDREWILPISARLDNQAGQFAGIALVTLRSGYFQSFYGSFQLGSQSAIALQRRDGIVMARWPADDKLIGIDLSKGHLFTEYLPNGPSGDFRFAAVVDGRERIGSYRTLDRYPLLVLVGLATDEVFAPWWAGARREGAVTVGIAAVLLALGLYLARQIDRRQAAESAIAVTSEQLESSQRFLRNLADNLPGVIGYWDRTLVCRFANAPFCALFGLSPDRIVGVHRRTLFGDSFFDWDEPYRSAVLRGERPVFETVKANPKGEVTHFLSHLVPDLDGAGRVVGFFSLAVDITSLKRTERLAQANAKRLALAAEAGGIGIWDYQLQGSETGRLIADAGMHRLFGLAPANPTATETETPATAIQPWRERIHPEDRPGLEQQGRALIAAGSEIDLTFRVSLPGGTERSLRLVGAIERTANGVPVRAIGIGLDISQTRRQEAALVAAAAAAAAESTAKGEILTAMAHEFGSPLKTILGLRDLIDRLGSSGMPGAELAEADKASVTRITHALQSLLGLLTDLQDYAELEAGRIRLEPRPFRLSDLTDRLAAVMTRAAEAKQLELVIGVAAAEPGAGPIEHLVGDRARIEQVLITLVGNGIKFTETGHVVVTLTTAPRGDDGAFVRFVIEDTGIAIDPAALPYLFDGLSRIGPPNPRRFGLAGLGLETARRLVRLMGGEIGAEHVGTAGTPAAGTRLWFALPLGRDARAARADSPAGGEPMRAAGDRWLADPAARDLQVLIVDDHDTARAVLLATATTLGWHAQAVASGPAALDQVRVQASAGRPFDVLLVDWRMPGMDGLAVSRALRATTGPGAADAHAPPIVIMVTAHDRSALARTAAPDLIDAVLVKPVTASALYEAVLGVRRQRAVPAPALAMPVAPPAGSAAGAPPAKSPEPAGRPQRLAGVRVLLVEDNPINIELASTLLAAEGAVTTIAEDGREAVARLALAPEGYDLVLMDVQMPVMDGFEATRLIRTRLKLDKLPVLALTAGVLKEDRDRAFTIGMNDFITKPIDPVQMIDKIRRHLPTPPAAPSPRFAAIEGIDHQDLDMRLEGDPALARLLFQALIDTYAEMPAELTRLIAQGDEAAAIDRLHSLRGAAANLSATALVSAAQTVEAAIAAGDDPAAAVAALGQTLARLIESARAALGPVE